MANRIKKFRTAAGLTLEELGDKVGSSKAYIWRMENKEKPTPTVQLGMKLAKALGVSVEDLFSEI